MSNKIVEDVYSGVINDVSKNVKYDFEEMGIEDIVLQELLSIWQHKLDDNNNNNPSNDDNNILQSLINQQQSLQQQATSSTNFKQDSNKISLDDFDDNKDSKSNDKIKEMDNDDDNAINSDLDDDDDDDDNDLDSNDDILILINDVNKLDYVALNKDLNLLFNSPNNLVLAGHDGVFQFDPSISNLSNLVLPVTSPSSPHHIEPITAIDASSNTLYFAREHNVYASDTLHKRIQLLYQGHTGIILELSLSTHQTHLASCSKAGALILHDLIQHSYHILNYSPRESLSCCAFSPHFNFILCTATASGTLLIHNTSFLNDPPYLIFPKLHPSPITSIAYSHASKSLIATVSKDGWIAVIDIETKSVIRVINTTHNLTSLAFEGALLVAGTADGRIFIYNLRSGSSPQTINCSSHPIDALIFQKDKRKPVGLKARDYAVHFAEPLVTDQSKDDRLTRDKKSNSSSNLSALAMNPARHSLSSLISSSAVPLPPSKDPPRDTQKDTQNKELSTQNLPVYMPSSAGALRPNANLTDKVNSDEQLHTRSRRTSGNAVSQPRPVSMANSTDSHLATVNASLNPNASLPRRRRHSSRSENRPRIDEVDWFKDLRENREKEKSSKQTAAPVSYHNNSLKRSGSSSSLRQYGHNHSRTNSIDRNAEKPASLQSTQPSQEETLKKLIESANALSLSTEIQKARDVLEGDYKIKLESYSQEIRKLRSENALLRRENDRIRRQ
ncbi:hypothetical protein E3P81_01834 [Wallemia ichthyophaga]|nr:hypothetical protein E3P97_01833 [Wallemia ichthyophaga]TIB30606.1 hypothetical protein E3P85_02625 [Wallemia ichthyophaga]TIB47080.1 hypothetical protein E3P82_01916 [Wallemia ichthyophaga]TIB51350.1 hypothetical protein E3P81_01834 [Wallemia ichthyophaga]TIB54041.1 hypothetical protein E3P80_01917 [Wallemia ichthyophaga]